MLSDPPDEHKLAFADIHECVNVDENVLFEQFHSISLGIPMALDECLIKYLSVESLISLAIHHTSEKRKSFLVVC